MELYSRNPPSIAPSKLEESAVATEVAFFSSEEKAKPEKKMGNVRISGTISLLKIGEAPMIFTYERAKLIKSDDISKP